MKLRESIHHGSYRFEREFQTPRTWNGWVDALMTSPYRGSATPEKLAANSYVADQFVELLTTGRTDHGWQRFEVIA